MASEYHVKSWDFSAWCATSLDKDFFSCWFNKDPVRTSQKYKKHDDPVREPPLS
jgi:hypothetical protein